MKNAVCFYHTIIYWSFSPGTDTSFFLAAVTNLLKPSLCNDIARPARYVSEKKFSTPPVKYSRFFSRLVPESILQNKNCYYEISCFFSDAVDKAL